MTKAMFINGSPRKNGNTAKLLNRAMEGAKDAGAEVEMVNLYDRDLVYKGCMSGFACKVKGGRKGVCSFKDGLQPVVNKPKRSASIFTINCPDLQMYKANAYDILMDAGAKNLGIFGPTEILYSIDTYQFHDYAKYDAAQIDETHKTQIRETQFPKDQEKAYELGKRLCSEGF
ncbi:flavodoxin family protein [Fibrobacter sp.]|uniref:flavodoxin family protein n=1 Tax=Fibrobacter sp. TaxID=35828 RepID=UPI0025C4B677|nr:NAD(P)H-dependent oxidoreductase [Fibrobacter sp.]MCI6436669.1 NAD(P)H-dependent oxidoreductase [Fibrobacter sp.]